MILRENISGDVVVEITASASIIVNCKDLTL